MREDSEYMQATMLLYLAGELPEGEAAELEKRITSDPGLSQSLEELRGLSEGLTLLLHQSDSIAIPAVRESRRQATVRQVSRAMVRRRLQVSAREADVAVEAKGLRLRNWSISIAAAIAIVAAGMFFLSNNNSLKLSKDVSSTYPSTTTQSIANDSSAVDGSAVATTTAPSVDVAYSGDTDAEDGSDDTGRDLLKVSEGDKSYLAIVPSGYDVSSMFEPQTE
jgi:hypothetical protein